MSISKNHEVRLRLRGTLRELSTRGKNAKVEYKDSQRASGGSPSADAADKRFAYSMLSTLLCVAQAHRRGKVHDPKIENVGEYIRQGAANVDRAINSVMTGPYYVKLREVWSPSLREAVLFAAEGKPIAQPAEPVAAVAAVAGR